MTKMTTALPHRRLDPRTRRRTRWLLAAVVSTLTGFTAACDGNPTEPMPSALEAAEGIERIELGDAAITVLSRNLYLGADLDALLTGGDPAAAIAAAFQELQTSNAGNMGRALALATEIATHRPHLVGLQEVTRYEIGPLGGPMAPLVDYIDALQAYLGFLGASYTVAERQANVTLTFPLILPGQPPLAITYQDGDAILARSDVVTEEPVSGHFGAQQTLMIGGTTFDNQRGWNAVTAVIGPHRLRFVNTHLEIQSFPEVQEAQARELVALLDAEPLPVVLVGDFNSAANHDAPEASRTRTYHILRSAGYADLWLRESGSVAGLTCCQSSTLTNPESELTQRLDLVLVRWGAAGFGGRSSMDVLGEAPGDRIQVVDGLVLWPSDHAGVTASMWPASASASHLPGAP